MQIEECDTEAKFRNFLRELNGEVDAKLFQKIVATALRFDLNPGIFGGGTTGAWGDNYTAKKYASGTSSPSHFVIPQCVDEIKKAFAQ